MHHHGLAGAADRTGAPGRPALVHSAGTHPMVD